MIKRVYGARDYEGRFASWPRVPSERRPLGPALWMETMFLVAGLAVAGLVGIAAAFYFSIRSGNRGDKRLRSARPDLSRPDLSGRPRRTANDGRPVTTFTPAASARPRRPGAARTAEPVGARRLADTQALPEDPWPGDAEAGNPWPDDAWPDDPMPGDPTATDPKLGTAALEAGETRPITTTATAKPRRRKGFRKGADLDEELWPAESFGGVSDEQFWDDLASDKPLATTARTAQQEPPSRSRLSAPAPGAGLLTGPAAAPTAGLDTGAATGPGRRQETRRARSRRRQAGQVSGPAHRVRSDGRTDRDTAFLRGDAAGPGFEAAAAGGNAAGPRGCHSAARDRGPAAGGCYPATRDRHPAARGCHPGARDRCPAGRGRHPADRDTPTAAEQRRGRPADQRGLLAAAERSGRRPVVPPGPERLSGPL
jgi:hypothetical protein